MPLLQEIPAPVTIKARLLFAMYDDKSVRRGSMTSVGSEIAILTFICLKRAVKGKEGKKKTFFFFAVVILPFLKLNFSLYTPD